MASVLEKAQTLIAANMHDMVDRALEANSVAVMKQYVRDAEDNLDALEDAAATVGGEVKFSCVDGPEFDAHRIDWDELKMRSQTYKDKENHICNLDRYE